MMMMMIKNRKHILKWYIRDLECWSWHDSYIRSTFILDDERCNRFSLTSTFHEVVCIPIRLHTTYSSLTLSVQREFCATF